MKVAAIVLVVVVAVALIYYLCWEWLLAVFVHGFFAPDKYKTDLERLHGESGRVCRDGEACMVRIRGDLWPCRCLGDAVDGEAVEVVGVEENVLVVQATKESEEGCR